MSKLRFPWFKTFVAAAVTTTLLFTPVVQALTIGGTSNIGSNYVSLSLPEPTIGWSDAHPDVFNPHLGERVYFNWRLDDAPGYVTLDIYDGNPHQGGTKLQNLHGPNYYPTTGYPPYEYSWDGKHNSVIVDDGTYYYMITTSETAYGPVIDEEIGTFVVVQASQGTAPIIGTPSHYDSTQYDWASPDPFYPQQAQTTTVHYSLNTSVNSVTVEFSKNAQVYETVSGGTSSGSNTAVWDGKSGSTAHPEGVYTYKITAANNEGSDYEYGTVELKHNQQGDTPTILSHDVSPDPFDPDEEDTCFDVRLDMDASYVELEIKDGSTLVYGPVQTGSLNDGWNYNVHCWDGEDNSNDQVAEDTYTYYLTAHNSNGDGNTVSGSVEVDYDSNQGEAPVIGDEKGDDSDDYADRDPFDPYEYSKTTIRFKLNTSANVRFTLSDGSDDIEELTYSASSGTNAVEWDGRENDGDPYPEDMYYYTIYAWNDYGTDTEHGTVEIDYDGSSGDRPNITNHFADPERFDPYEEDTRIYFSIDDDAYMTLEILDGNTVIRTLLDEVYKNEGAHSRYWDGEDKYGDIVDDGDYEYRLKACNSDDECDVEYGDIEVDSDGSGGDGDLISDIDVNNEVFDPTDDEYSEICFTIERDNTEITVQIMDGSRVVDTLVDEVEYDEGYRKCVRWDGEDDDGDIVDDDVYQFRIRAEEGNDVQVEYEYVEVDTDGIIIGFPDDDDYCAGFWDVPKDSPFCKAIELMKFRGIFTGYPDGSFRPYNPINRAEVTKVVLLALDYNILSDDGTNLGFWDVQKRAWYMSYLRTAQRNGIIHGYPDGSFRPNNNMNRVELLKVFLEATDIEIPHCNYSPYPDTPLNFETRWYMDYACFAKAYNLMNTDANGYFHPAEPMTRADVAELFYRFEKRGLFAGYSYDYYDNYWDTWDPYWNYSPYGMYYEWYY